MGFIEEEVEQYRLQYSTESVELQVIHLSFFIWNSLLRCWAIQELNDIFGVIVQSLWFFGRCTFFFFLQHPACLLSIYTVFFHCRPFKCLSLSLPLNQTTLMLMSLKPQVLLVPLEVWHQSQPPPSPGPNFPGMKLQGPQLSSLFSNNSGSQCECVSDRMVMSVPETEPQSSPLSSFPFFGNGFVPVCKTDTVITFPPIVDPLGICCMHTKM